MFQTLYQTYLYGKIRLVSDKLDKLKNDRY